MASPSDPELEGELRQQSCLGYGALIGVGVVMTQPFLTATDLDTSATISVVAFAVAIPLLAALILLNRQERFRGRTARSMVVSGAQVVAQLSAGVGLVAGFWHIDPVAWVVLLVSSVVALVVHSVGYSTVEREG